MIAPRPRRRVLPRALTPVPAGDLAAHFEGLGNPTRLSIVERLARASEMRVSDLALELGVSQPRMSWHLRFLRRARVITTRRDGREVFCRLDREAIDRHLHRFTELLAGHGSPEPTLGDAVPGRAARALGGSELPLSEVSQ
ncbi:MAG TPA: metalloregulator ArsR/SmtB family transcription factor [Verrucomicrobiae bacterium]|nr:metalloregulator ArsR/SmtB family transcription factor [Verrucomicrobiae bacterium]